MIEISIRNMVCDRCIKAVTTIFNDAGVSIERVQLRAVSTQAFLNEDQISSIKEKL